MASLAKAHQSSSEAACQLLQMFNKNTAVCCHAPRQMRDKDNLKVYKKPTRSKMEIQPIALGMSEMSKYRVELFIPVAHGAVLHLWSVGSLR
ncbi:hypothetical protein FQN60_009105 [Etheostoma spectabile]|uniref:Uncharacterized protein n=1 Tax=Etheostoma spectabile TaxID=54343 RepID=A0A5J5CGR8_9PERO|nr:hypothetical protein FQN60_018679 [Etheostoma spectabile]KAA8582365.1 hypothetical protein FQN60_009105 [Etheostoma spectabile]